jgi:hypothetical protein
MSIVNRWILFSLFVGVAVHVVTIDVLGHQPHRSIVTDVVQGTIAGGVMGFFTVQIVARIKTTRINGWITLFGCGVPGNGMLFRAVCALVFPGPVNVPQEAMYWTTSKDGEGCGLNGRHDYMMHFPPGGLPPNDAFWSLTMGDANQASGLLTGRPAELAEQFAGLLWRDLMVSLLLGVAERPNPREIARRARDAAAAFLQLHPLPNEGPTGS